MKKPRALIVPLTLGLLLTSGSTCRNNTNTSSPKLDDKLQVVPKALPTPLWQLAPEGAMILSVERDVKLKRQGSTSFVPILSKVWFAIGDTLQIGQDSLARILCQEGICVLRSGTYESCCTGECPITVRMMRTTTGDAQWIAKTDLSSAEAAAFVDAEKNIYQLQLGEVTTQFLITNLYSGWKLKETNQQLDRLTIQLDKPEAQQELQELYRPVVRRTGDLNLRLERFDDAKKLYQLNIVSSLQTTESTKKTVANEKAASHVGLAEVYKHKGNDFEAIHSLESAKGIYLKQGETDAAAKTEKEIVNLRHKTVQPK